MEITKKEIIASVSIIAIMLLIGLAIFNKIVERKMDSMEKYNKALKISDEELFKYAMSTNVGNAFVYGQLEAVDAITLPEIDGEYLYVEKVKEVYTRHTRTVTYTDSKGKTKTKTEEYWTWDENGREEFKSQKIKFLNVEFNTYQINIPDTSYIDTIKTSMHVRYKYYGYPSISNCTIFSYLSSNNIQEKDVTVYAEQTIEETIEHLESNAYAWIFWIFWILLIGLCVYGFYYLENDWLN